VWSHGLTTNLYTVFIVVLTSVPVWSHGLTTNLYMVFITCEWISVHCGPSKCVCHFYFYNFGLW